MGTFTANPVARSWLLAALAAATLAPGRWAAPALLLLALAWLVTRPGRRGLLPVGVAVLVALGLLTTELVLRPAGEASAERLIERGQRGYAELWRQLDGVAEAAAAELGAPSDDEAGRLEAFETLSRVLSRKDEDEVTLLLTDPNGAARAWAGPGLLHEPREPDLARGPRSHIAGFSAVTLFRGVPLGSGTRPWRLVAGRSLSTDRLPFGGVGQGGQPLRWTLLPAGAGARPGLLTVPLAGAPNLLIEDPAGRRVASPAADLARRGAMLVLALGLLLAAARAPSAGALDLGRWLRPHVGVALFALAVALGAGPARAAGLVAALAWAGLSWRDQASRGEGGGRLRGAAWGLVAAAAALGIALALQLRGEPLDLGESLVSAADPLALRLALAALVLGLLARALGGSAGAGRGTRWAWGATALLLAAAAAHDLPLVGGGLLLAGAAAAGCWAAGRRGEAATLGVLTLCAALIGAGGWELAYRFGLRRHLEGTVLPRLSLPTNAELKQLSGEVREYLSRVDLERIALQDPDLLDRQDLAFELWHHSPLAARGVLSALAVVPEEGAISRFAFGLPLTEAGRPDDSPLRQPEPALPVWDDIRESGSVELNRAGRRWGVVRYWLEPRPGFRLEALPLENLAARLLRDGPFLRPPAEELAAPASFALFGADGLPAYTAWGEGPRLGEGLLAGGRGVVATPSGPATIYTATGPEGIRALVLPHLHPGRALERVGVNCLSVLGVLGAALLLAALAGSGWRLRPALRSASRSYSRRMLAVYGLLLLAPVLLLNAVFVRFMSERLQRDQRAAGEAALESAQRVLGEYVLSLETGFVIDTQLDNELLVWLAGVIRQDVNLYWGSTVYVSSKPELFTAGFLPRRIPGEIYARLLLRSRERASRRNRVSGTDYLELYGPLEVPGVALDRARLFVSVPLLAQQEEVAGEIAALRRRAALVTSALILLMAAVGVRLGRGFSEPLMRIVRGTQDIAEGAASLSFQPPDEELATLARAIDRMAGRIAEGRRRLTREKKVIELMVENINSAVMSLDAERRVVLHNRVARELLGAQVGEPIGDPEAAASGLAAVHRFAASSGDRPRQRTISLPSEDDQPREWSLVWAPLPGRGEPAALLVVEDVTEVLRGQRLEAWAEMARIIAHEIKNPLTPIRLSAEHMRQVWREEPEKFEGVLERCTANILQQVEELRVIAMEFSTYSKIPHIERSEADLTATVAEVVAAYESAPRDAAKVRWRGPNRALRLEIDARLLGRAVRNLIENALRVSPDGTPVEVALESAADEAVIRVADRGPGVAPALLGKIFDPYFSTHDTGTGLGLPIARRIAESHGGTMRARNREGGGLEVSIHLPLAGGPEMAPPAGGVRPVQEAESAIDDTGESDA
jgi:signal transduction histidine kinase